MAGGKTANHGSKTLNHGSKSAKLAKQAKFWWHFCQCVVRCSKSASQYVFCLIY